MGVDVGIKFRFLDEANIVKLEVEVTELDQPPKYWTDY